MKNGVNFVFIFSLFSGLKFLQTPLWLERYVRFAPTLALSEIVAASSFIDENGVPFSGWASKIYAALIASCIALLTRSIMVTIVVGLFVLWLLG